MTKQKNVGFVLEAEQTSLFVPNGNPLENRLGKAFFDELPTDPGVYLMYGRSGRLLYVGKAKNLRNRLFTYRRVKSGYSSCKTRRLVRMTTEIEIMQTETEQAALLKENALIRSHKPEFNHAKKSPETYYFLTLKPASECYDFRLAMRLPDEKKMHDFTYGAFKGHRTIRKGTGALLRQLYLLEHGVRSAFDFPTVLTNKLTPLAYRLPISQKIMEQELVHQFLEGQSLDFISQLVENVTKRGLFGEYIRRLILKDCEALKRLYDHCLSRNFQLKEKLNLNERLIPQEKLDDYLIRAAFLS